MSGRLRTQPGAAREGTNHLPFEFDGHGRGCRTRQLGIEQADDAVGALSGKIRPGLNRPK